MKQKIKINIAGRDYPFDIESKDEYKVRQAAKRINDEILSIHNEYADRDIQDTLSLVLLLYVVRYIELEDKEEISDIIKELQLLDKQLGTYIISR
ncbi:MAG: cell division protein ZapA [Bacteroidales bacterium]|jgi:hypothetical protein|nr:cell division protein ZapA [Bacteroidales bacterium]